MVVGSGCACQFGDASVAVKVCVGAIGQYLRQCGVEVKGVAGGDGVDGLLQAVANPVVGEAVGIPTLGDGGETVG